ncbi:DUF167 domain-containing protein [Micromonospora endolithica]|uniref:UPF0235 protein D7223_03205 n=1 Tax=Micromonospora endolithica TaxID=230091 RepID=A0A3A9ZRD9_9ACTN|nr:DUF167 domain-containing protein [Micromonospora endolithica]RKN50775.1 DUF167 domain-containing protein [Micromonospora endolithica]TWJ20469.1 hypothetical protein JD76_00567 [Micromonospora endolithica]
MPEGRPERAAGQGGPTGTGTLTVAVRVKPGASRNRVGGCFAGPHGPALVIAVNAPAVDGRATEAARRALADALGVRPGTVSLRTGAVSRDKLFQVDPATEDLAGTLRRLRDGSAG